MLLCHLGARFTISISSPIIFKSIANKLLNRQSTIKNKIHSIALELKHVINHYDVRRGVYATILNAKERSFAKNSRDIKT